MPIPALINKETQLFEKINFGFSSEFWKRLTHLTEKRSNLQLSEVERSELISMTDLLEAANVERIKALIELAALRNTDLELLMEELGLLYGKNFQKD